MDGDEDPGKIHFIVPKFWKKSRMRSATQPYCNTVEYGCVPLRMRFFSLNFGTIKRILPGSSSPSHRERSGIEVGNWSAPSSFPGLIGCLRCHKPWDKSNVEAI